MDTLGRERGQLVRKLTLAPPQPPILDDSRMAIFQKSASAQQATAPDFYTWTFPGAPVRIHMQLEVIEHLAAEIKRAFHSVPSHSVEIGGLLLGRADLTSSPVVEIKSFQPFLSEYRLDHKFILSESDRRKLESQIAACPSERHDGLTAVGFYRSHIGESLSMRPEDVAVAQKHFCDPANVFLIVKPATDGSTSAGFFFWDNGHIDSEFTFLEFPFEAHQLTGVRVNPARAAATAKPVREPAREEAPPEARPLSPVTLPPAPRLQEFEALEKAARRGFRWWYLLVAALALVLAVVGFQAYMKWTPAPASGAPVASDSAGLTLQVERHGADLRVRWDRRAPAVLNATQAVLAIRDGDLQQQELRLDLDQLRNGSVLYTPSGGTVQFRLEVTGPGPENAKTAETVLALLAPKPDAAGGPPTSGAGSHVQPPVTSPPGANPPPTDTTARDRMTPAQNFGEPVRVVLVDPVKPATGSPASGALPQPFTPALPIHEVQPKLPPSARNAVASLVEVEIKVQINASGRVARAEALPTNGAASGFLVGAARNAARLWRFVPARRGNQPVPSEMILKFQYRPSAAR